MRFIAYYLPQFHTIPENDEMWGKGFTDWDNVRNAKPLFKDHFQPVEPLEDNYYDLSDTSKVMRWQIELAKKYGIYGFCFYHYWYNGHLIMEKPIEQFLHDQSLNIPFCICWANHDWILTWGEKAGDLLYRQNYSDVNDWDIHFNYLLPFFKDKRYIKNNGKPLVVLYEAARIPELNDLLDRWNDLAIQNDLPGLEFAYEGVNADIQSDFDDSRFCYDIEYQPLYARVLSYQKKKSAFKSWVHSINERLFHLDMHKVSKTFSRDKLTIFDYDDLWEHVLSMGPVSSKSIPGVFTNVDTTPRKKYKGMISLGMDPTKLEKYLVRQIVRAKKDYNTDMIFVFAWNEWAEGAYMEPDKKWGFGVLEAFKHALELTDEFPK